MQILKLSLENAKAHAEAHYEFTSGINAIVGENGAGKSTILEAIGFALFDTMNYRQADFVREGAKTATITVTILSDLDERRYEIIRRCGGSSQYYAFDPDLNGKICEGKNDVLAFLKEHMQVDPAADLAALFNDAVGVPQGTLTAAFLQSASIRKKAFDTLLQVEEYKDAADKLREPGRKLRDQMQAIDLTLKEVETRLERLPELQAQVAARRKALEQLDSERSQCQQKLDEANAEIDAQSTVQKEILALQEKSRQLTQRLASLAREVDGAKRALAEAENSQQIVAANQAGYEQYQQAQAQQTTLGQQQKERQQLETKRSQLQQALSTVTAEMQMQQRALAEIAEAQQVVSDLTDAVQQQEKLEIEVQELERKGLQLTEWRQSLPRLQTRVDQLQMRARQLEEAIANQQVLTKQRQQLDTQLKEIQNLLPQFSHAMGQFQVEAESLKEQIASLQEIDKAICPICEQPLTEAHRTALMQRNDSQLATLRQSYSLKRKEEEAAKQQVSQQQDELSQLDEQLRKLPRSEELTEVSGEIAETQAQINTQQALIAELEATMSNAKSVQEALAALENPRQRRALAAEKITRRNSVEESLSELTERQQIETKKIAALTDQLVAFAGLEETINQVQETLTVAQPGYQAVLAHQQIAMAVAERTTRLSLLNEECTMLQSEHKENEGRLELIWAQFDEKKFHAAQEKAEKSRAEMASNQARTTLLQNDQQRNEAEMERLTLLQAEREDAQAQRETLACQSDTLETIRTYLRQAGPYITRTLIQQVSSGADQIFGDLMQDYSRHLSWDEEYGIALDVEGRQRQFAQLSGGEQMSAALSVRLALLREMSNIDIAFFDEPTTNLDTARRESLARQILEVKGFQQLFVISHDDTFEQSIENVIRLGSRKQTP